MKQSEDVAIIRSDDECISVKEVLAGKHDTALKYATQYAILSAKVYDAHDDELFSLIDSWKKLDIEFEAYRPKIKGLWIDGLRVHAYYKKEDDTAYVVIVFRGTRFTKWRDWYSNANWITKFVPFVHNAYKQTQLQINLYLNGIEEQLKENNIIGEGEKIKFTATGHSLGGGLAQQAAYASKKIETVFAYDSSPVTGFYSVKKQQRIENCKDLNIYRIWEHGEILLYLRHITKTVQKLSLKPNIDPRIVEVRFNFLENTNAISEHSIITLARSLEHAEKMCIRDFA